MTRRINTELARTRAAARALRAPDPSKAEATVQPAIVATLADAKEIVARELRIMKQAQAGGAPMALADAKKLQALVSALGQADNIERDQQPDMENLSDEELAAELARLHEGSKA